jgi:IgA Peptidase M64/FG-GAP-like repeat
MPNSVTQIRSAGPPGVKRNLAILGDGFAAGDQTLYNDKVQQLVIDGVFGHDYFYEDAEAWNIYRVNLVSNVSGVSQRKYNNGTILSTTLKDTALGIIYSGSWAHCWLEYGANSNTLILNALNTWVPDYNFVLVILNEPGWGGCGGGGRAHVTLAGDWSVTAHEFGHGLGGLADEYCGSNTYAGGESGSVDLTINTNRATLKWGNFVAPTTPIPTGSGSCVDYTQGAKPAGWDDNQDVGTFEGAGAYYNRGIYRPVINCRMRSNVPPYCPVCYTSFKKQYDTYTGHSFLKCYAGDFNGDGKSDLLNHNGNSIMLYRSNGSQLDLVFSAVGIVPGSWQFMPNDRFYVGDFNGDGKDEVVVFNGTDWVTEYLGLLADDGANGLKCIARYDNAMTNWDFTSGDQFFVADFDGDGKQDLFVFNGSNWGTPYLAMLKSSGTGFSVAQKYSGSLPGWIMRPNDRYYVGDFTGDGKKDLWVFNGKDWSIPYLGMLKSNGTSLTMSQVYNTNLPGWIMKPGDQHWVGDFDGDGKADLYVFNGSDWSTAYLGMLKSTGTALTNVQVYNGNVPGWQMRKNDLHWLADINGDGKADLFVFNALDWSTEYLGAMCSTGTGLATTQIADWVGEWNLGKVDQFEVCNYEGVAGKRDLFVHNQDWFGMIRSTPGFSLQKIYYRWIHNYRYGRNW